MNEVSTDEPTVRLSTIFIHSQVVILPFEGGAVCFHQPEPASFLCCCVEIREPCRFSTTSPLSIEEVCVDEVRPA